MFRDLTSTPSNDTKLSDPKFFNNVQYHALEVTVRLSSVFSIIGTSFIFITFCTSKSFRKPINRLVFYASWGNTLMNTATLISVSGIAAGKNASLCQAQAFLMQMFEPADALWNLAMAINVYLTVFQKYDAEQLRSLEWRYILMCYGGPFIPAFVFCFVETTGRGKMYGPAELWCWISFEWDFIRLAICYATAWFCIVVSFSIYIIAGMNIYKRGGQLRFFKHQNSGDMVHPNPLTNTRTTEIEISSELASTNHYEPRSSLSKTRATDGPPSIPGYEPYSIRIERAPTNHQLHTMSTPTTPGFPHRPGNNVLEANTAAKAYTKCAMLFFVSLLITWVPASLNRVYAHIHRQNPSFALNYVAGVVLPLMGFWNTVIYVYTSWPACKSLFSRRFPSFRKIRRRGRMSRAKTWLQASLPSGNSKDSISESTRGFAV